MDRWMMECPMEGFVSCEKGKLSLCKYICQLFLSSFFNSIFLFTAREAVKSQNGTLQRKHK